MNARAILFVPVFSSMIFITSCSDALFGCGQKITSAKTSPDKTKTMYRVARDCGATTAPLISVAIVPQSELKDISSEGRQIRKKYVFMSYERGAVRTKWISDDVIEVLYDHSMQYGREGSFFKQETKIGDVKIVYREMKLQD